MTAFQFTKMQGLGNDFVVIEGPLRLDSGEIQSLCDRRFGIGADGVLVATNGEPVRMEYWNADGSPAEMCGNGLRCVARYAYDRSWSAGRNFSVRTPMGEKAVRVLEDGIEVDLGMPSVSGHTTIDGDRYHLVDIGNPHAVVIVDDPATTPVEEIGPRVATDTQFPNGTNVEFMKVDHGRIDMRVWERGVGETMACGTGIVAAAFVATKTDGLESPVSVMTPGGQASVDLRDGAAWLTGPADYVFRGSVGER